MLICHTLIHGNEFYVGNTIYLEKWLEEGTDLFLTTFSLSCLTPAYISPLVKCRLGERNWALWNTYLPISFAKKFQKRGWIIQDAFGLILNSVGNSRHRVEHWNIKFWDVGEDKGICKVEIWQGIREYLNCLEIICTITEKMSHFSLPIFQVLQQNGNLEKTLHFVSVQVQ